jgi:hypothetical protein
MFVALACLLLSLPAEASPTDWVESMRRAWSAVDSYRGTQRVQERVDGELLPDQRMSVVFRKPWEIQLVWETVHPGRRVYWSPTRFGGNVRVHPGGWTGRATGILTLAPTNPMLKQESNHTMAEAGFGYLIEQVTSTFARGAADASLPPTRPDVVEGEPVWSVDLGPSTQQGYARAELAIGQQTNLPVRWAAYDATGNLIERYHWLRVQVNTPIVERVDFDLAYGTE